MMIFGYILSDGTLLETKQYRHVYQVLEHFSNDPAFAPVLDKYAKEERALETIGQDCQEMIDIGEHPSWHIYEMAQDAMASKLSGLVYTWMYEQGHVRYASTGHTLFVEGPAASIKKLRRAAVKLAEDYDKLLEVHVLEEVV